MDERILIILAGLFCLFYIYGMYLEWKYGGR